MQENNPGETGNAQSKAPAIPKPVFMRLLLLFCGGIGCLLVGVVVSLVTSDHVLLVMSLILGISFVTKGILLKRKLRYAQIYSVSGVCVSITPKMLGRYRSIELVNTDTGDDAVFVLPKKVSFKVGHVYTCYFENQIKNRQESNDAQNDGFFNVDMNFPTSGFLGFEDFGIYQEKPVTVAESNSAEKIESTTNKEEKT